jgi:hypothetical protein
MSNKDGYSTSTIPGNTALHAAKKFGTSVVIGHTVRLGICSHTAGYRGDEWTVTGMEIGTLMVRKTARSMGGQQGFGLLIVDGQTVKPEVVTITKGLTVRGGSQGRLG